MVLVWWYYGVKQFIRLKKGALWGVKKTSIVLNSWWLLENVAGCQRTPKTSNRAHFQGWCPSENGQNPKNKYDTHFQGWWWPDKGQNPEDEQSCSFSGLVTVSEQTKLQVISRSVDE
jgi:hypothetical protein